jgi:hypothetical protein
MRAARSHMRFHPSHCGLLPYTATVVVLLVLTGADCEGFSRRLRIRRTSTKISPVSVQIRHPSITKSGSIVSGPPPLIIIMFSLYSHAKGSEGDAAFALP